MADGSWVTGDSVLEFREFKSFEVRFFEDCKGVALVLFYRFLEAVPVGIPVMLGIFPGVYVGQGVPSGEGEIGSVAQTPHFLVYGFIKPFILFIFLKRCHAVWCCFRQFLITCDTFFAEVIGLIPLPDAQVQVFFQFGLPFLQLGTGHSWIKHFGKLTEDLGCSGKETAFVVYPVFDKPFVLPDQCGPVRIVEGLRMADTENPRVQRPRHSVEVVIISGEILVRPGIGIAMNCDAGAVEVACCQRGVHDPIGIFRARGGVEPVHLAVFTPGGFGLGITGDEVKDGVYAKELCFGFEDVHGLTDVVAVGCGSVFVDLKDHAVVVHVLGGDGDYVGIRGGEACPSGYEVGYLVVEFYVHGLWLIADGAWKKGGGYHEGHEGQIGQQFWVFGFGF